MEKTLSNFDIERALGKKNIDIIDYNDLHEGFVLPNKRFIALLYRANGKKETGHWILLTRLEKNKIEHFEPLGHFIDSKDLNKSYPILSLILLRNGIDRVVFNKHAVQKQKKGVNTCGRHIILRAIFFNLSLKDYIKKILKNKNIGKDPDNVVVNLTDGTF